MTSLNFEKLIFERIINLIMVCRCKYYDQYQYYDSDHNYEHDDAISIFSVSHFKFNRYFELKIKQILIYYVGESECSLISWLAL